MGRPRLDNAVGTETAGRPGVKELKKINGKQIIRILRLDVSLESDKRREKV